MTARHSIRNLPPRLANATLAAVLTAVCVDTTVRADDALVETVRACAALRTDAERLACFDRRVVPAATGSAPAASPSQEEMFGMSGNVAQPETEESPAAAPSEPESISEISAQVTSLKSLARGEQVVSLDNGQVWQTVEQHQLLLTPGDTVTITRAALGTFRLVTSSHRTARVKRLQ